MDVLITGAAGNLGSYLTRSLLDGPHHLRLLVHRTPVSPEIANRPRVAVHRGDLGVPDSLQAACRGADCIVHFAGVLFRPRPERFLGRTNVDYVRNLLEVARAQGVRRFILVSFPHVEGESTPRRPAGERLDGAPASAHARTRLAAERLVLAESPVTGVSLRAGMIYARGVLMIDAARWLAQRGLLAVWRHPTWIHLISLPDFLACCRAAIEGDRVRGIYNLGDEAPTTLQAFLDAAAVQWRVPLPWRLPRWSFYAAGAACEAFASVFGTTSPLTRDFIRIGMASYCGDTTRMRADLLSVLQHPTLAQGVELL